eukprot:14123_1
MLSLLIILHATARVNSQCNEEFCPNVGDRPQCSWDDPNAVSYKCDSLGGGYGGDPDATCTTFPSFCHACRDVCFKQTETTTADMLFNDIYHCQPGECTESPTKSPIEPGSPTSGPTPAPTHRCASSLTDCDKCDTFPSEEWYCNGISAQNIQFDCTNTDNICDACCHASFIQREGGRQFETTTPGQVFDMYCSTGNCPTLSPSPAPTTQAPSHVPTRQTGTPTTAQPTTPDIGDLEVIWESPFPVHNADLTQWTITTADEAFMFAESDEDLCPGNTGCWTLCSGDEWNSNMQRSASTEGFDNIAFRYSITPVDMTTKKSNERCLLKYEVDGNWYTLDECTDDIVRQDELKFLEHTTWDAETVLIKLVPMHDKDAGGGGESCCSVSGFYLYGRSVPTPQPTEDPTDSPTRKPSYNPSITPTQNPSKNPANTLPDPTSFPTNNPVTSTGNPTDNPAVIPTNNPVMSGSDPTNNPVMLPTESPVVNPVIHTTDNEQSGSDDDDDDDSKDSQKGGKQEFAIGEVMSGTMMPVILGGAGALICLIIVIVCGLRMRKRKREVRNSVAHMRPDPVPAQSPMSDGAVALPMGSGTADGEAQKDAALPMDSDMSVGNTKTEGDGGAQDTGNKFAFPKHQNSLHYVTRGGPDSAANKPVVLQGANAESDDDDVIIGMGQTAGGMMRNAHHSKQPTDSDDGVLIGMQTPQNEVSPLDDEDENVPAPPLPPSAQNQDSDSDDLILMGMQTPQGNEFRPMEDDVVPPPPLPPTGHN